MLRALLFAAAFTSLIQTFSLQAQISWSHVTYNTSLKDLAIDIPFDFDSNDNSFEIPLLSDSPNSVLLDSLRVSQIGNNLRLTILEDGLSHDCSESKKYTLIGNLLYQSNSQPVSKSLTIHLYLGKSVSVSVQEGHRIIPGKLSWLIPKQYNHKYINFQISNHTEKVIIVQEASLYGQGQVTHTLIDPIKLSPKPNTPSEVAAWSIINYSVQLPTNIKLSDTYDVTCVLKTSAGITSINTQIYRRNRPTGALIAWIVAVIIAVASKPYVHCNIGSIWPNSATETASSVWRQIPSKILATVLSVLCWLFRLKCPADCNIESVSLIITYLFGLMAGTLAGFYAQYVTDLDFGTNGFYGYINIVIASIAGDFSGRTLIQIGRSQPYRRILGLN